MLVQVLVQDLQPAEGLRSRDKIHTTSCFMLLRLGLGLLKRKNILILNQLTDDLTVIFGGRLDKYGIVTLNWTTMTYTDHSPKLIRPRQLSTCAVIQNLKGQKVKNLFNHFRIHF